MDNYNQTDDYNSEPVRFCSKCLSLKIKYEEVLDMDCCGECGCTDITEDTIENWENLYKTRYGHPFISKDADIKKSHIFKMSFSKLMTKVSECPKWESIISNMYPHFPSGLSKTDSIVLLFDKLIKDNQLDKLRTLMYKMKL